VTASIRRTFGRSLGRLDREGFLALVVALWRARGRSARTTDAGLSVDGRLWHPCVPGRRPAVLAAHRAARAVRTGPAEGVATPDPAVAARLDDRGVPVLGPGRIERALLYDLPRPRAAALAARQLPRPSPLRRLAPSDGRVVPAALATVAALLLVVAGALAVPVGPGADRAGADAATTVDPRTATPTPAATATATAGPGERRYPPGVSSAGLVDVDALAAAHARHVTGRSYVWTVRRRERIVQTRPALSGGRSASRPGPPVSRTRREVRVERPAVYRVVETRSRRIESVPPSVTEVYADGERRFVRLGGGAGTETSVRPAADLPGGWGLHALRAARLLRGTLADTGRSSVSWNGSARAPVRLAVRGRTGDAEFRARAGIEPSGFVRSFRAWWIDPAAGLWHVVAFRYERVDRTAVEPPAWYEDGRVRTPAPGAEPNRTVAPTPV
jgi:hypothetical protein